MPGARYVMIGLDSEEEADELLELVDDGTYELLVAKRTDGDKVKLRKFKIRTVYLKDV